MSVQCLSELNPRVISEMSNDQLVQVAQKISQVINHEFIQQMKAIINELLARDDGKDAGLVFSMIHDEDARVQIVCNRIYPLNIVEDFSLNITPAPVRQNAMLGVFDRYCAEEFLKDAIDFAQTIFPEKSYQEILDFVAQRCFWKKNLSSFGFVALSNLGASVSDEVWVWLAGRSIPKDLQMARFLAAKISNEDQFSQCFQRIAQSYLSQGMLVEAHSVAWQIPNASIVKGLLVQQIPELQNQPEALERIAAKDSAFFSDFCSTLARRAIEAREYKKAVSVALIIELEKRNAILAEIVQAVRNNPEQLREIINQIAEIAADICALIVVRDVNEERWESAINLIELFGDRRSRTIVRIPFAQAVRQNPARLESLDPALQDRILLQLVKTDMEQGHFQQAVIEACRMHIEEHRNHFLVEILQRANYGELKPISDQIGMPLFHEICLLFVEEDIQNHGLRRAWELARLIPGLQRRDALFVHIIQKIRNIPVLLHHIEQIVCQAVEIDIEEQDWELAVNSAQYISDQSQRNGFLVQIIQAVRNDPTELRSVVGQIGMPLAMEVLSTVVQLDVEKGRIPSALNLIRVFDDNIRAVLLGVITATSYAKHR